MNVNEGRCLDIGSRLAAYIEQELSVAEARLVRAHLERCPVCRADAARMGRALEGLRRLQPVALPTDLRGQLFARIALSERPARPALGRLRWAGAAAALALAVVSTAVVMRTGRDAGTRAAGPSAVRIETAKSREPIAAMDPVSAMDPISAMDPSRERPVSGPPLGVTPQPIGPGSAPAQPLAAQPDRRLASAGKPLGAPESMLDVADKRGVTARILLADRDRAKADRVARAYWDGEKADGVEPRTTGLRPAGHAYNASMDGPSPGWNDRVRIGDTVTELRGEAEWDDSGRLRTMRVSAETLAASEAEAAPEMER
ncbi:MAG: zf-HC2 domain-containing protein [Armatimonadetes bacterium]|nr:zf-HC2 domain-containing protein [Armatimonadota bacterium]